MAGLSIPYGRTRQGLFGSVGVDTLLSRNRSWLEGGTQSVRVYYYFKCHACHGGGGIKIFKLRTIILTTAIKVV